MLVYIYCGAVAKIRRGGEMKWGNGWQKVMRDATTLWKDIRFQSELHLRYYIVGRLKIQIMIVL